MNIFRSASTFLLVTSLALSGTFLSSSAHSQIGPRTINLCTGAEGGVYNQVGEIIKNFENSSAIDINVVVTGGTSENMDKTLNGECDAMIGQPDGPVLLKRTKPADAGNILPVMKLHSEYLHVLCSIESKISDLSDVVDSGGKYSVAVGNPGSGGWLIWQNLVEQYPKMGDVPVTSDSGVTALAAVAANQTTCMIVPSGSPNAVVANADANFGDVVALVPANDRRFNNATDIDGKPLYVWKDVPTNAYKTTFNRYWSKVTTISWNASLYVNKQRLTGKELETFLSAATRARTQILSTFGK